MVGPEERSAARAGHKRACTRLLSGDLAWVVSQSIGQFNGRGAGDPYAANEQFLVPDDV
jgi:hypothetical protein